VMLLEVKSSFIRSSSRKKAMFRAIRTRSLYALLLSSSLSSSTMRLSLSGRYAAKYWNC
jgi:hypothetical protein